MTPFDYLFIAVLVAYAAQGFVYGFVREIFGIFAWVVSIWASLRLASYFEPFVYSVTDSPTARWLLASLIVGTVIFLLVVLIGRRLSHAISESMAGPINRMLGMLLGGAKALVVAGIATFVGLQFGLSQQEWWVRSHLSPVAMHASLLLDRVVDFRTLLSGDRRFEMPKAMQDTERRARDLLNDINEAAAPPSREQ